MGISQAFGAHQRALGALIAVIGSREITAGIEAARRNGKVATLTVGLSHDVSTVLGIGRHYRKAWTDAGHPGEAPVYLRCPGFVAKTDAAAKEAYGPTLMRHFQNQSRLLADSSRRQNSPPDHRAGKPRSASLKLRSRKRCAVRCSLAHPIRWWGS